VSSFPCQASGTELADSEMTSMHGMVRNWAVTMGIYNQKLEAPVTLIQSLMGQSVPMNSSPFVTCKTTGHNDSHLRVPSKPTMQRSLLRRTTGCHIERLHAWIKITESPNCQTYNSPPIYTCSCSVVAAPLKHTGRPSRAIFVVIGKVESFEEKLPDVVRNRERCCS